MFVVHGNSHPGRSPWVHDVVLLLGPKALSLSFILRRREERTNLVLKRVKVGVAAGIKLGLGAGPQNCAAFRVVALRFLHSIIL